MEQPLVNPELDLQIDPKLQNINLQETMSQISQIQSGNSDQNNFDNLSQNKDVNYQLEQNRLALIQNCQSNMLVKDNKFQGIQEMNNTVSGSLGCIARMNLQLQQSFKDTLQNARDNGVKATDLALQQYMTKQMDVISVDFDVQKYKKNVLGIISIEGDAINDAFLKNARTRAEVAGIFAQQIQNLSKGANKFFIVWSKVQQTTRIQYEKDVKLQQENYYKRVKAIEAQKLTQLKLMEKQSKQNEKKKLREIKVANQKYNTQLKMINKKITDQQQRQKQKNQIAFRLKKQTEQQNNRFKDLQNARLQKQRVLKQEAQEKQAKSKQQLQKQKVQLQLKKQQKENKQAMIKKQYQDSLKHYQKELEDAKIFLQNQRRLGRGYNWGSTPPSIVTSFGERSVKKGLVWYTGK